MDHDILIDRLENIAGIRGVALDWLKSYLSERKQCVTIDGISSTSVDLEIGVPQGSVLGPLLFLVYILPLQDIIGRHTGIQHLGYADDRQLYTRFDMRDMGSYLQALHRMQACLEDVRVWMVANRLKLNESKTEFMVITCVGYTQLG